MATRTGRVLRWMAAALAAVFFLGAGFRALATCASFDLPFTDLGSTSFCAQIAEAYYAGLSNGTSLTAYSPTANVPREQMAAFITRTLDQALLRGNRRAALGQWWNTTSQFGQTDVGGNPSYIQSDGADLWTTDYAAKKVFRVRAIDGKLLGTWTGAFNVEAVLIAMGRVFVTDFDGPAGTLYMIDPSAAPGSVTTVTANLGNGPVGITFDGEKIWTANYDGSPGAGSISIVTPGTWTVMTVSTGFTNPFGALFDGTNVWITDAGDGTIKKLDSAGAILQSVSVGDTPLIPIFDGHNIWVPNNISGSLAVVRASDGTILKTFASNQNGLSSPRSIAFDGQRILVTNDGGGVSLFKASDLSPIGFFPMTGLTPPYGVSSDGSGFWVSFPGSGVIERF